MATSSHPIVRFYDGNIRAPFDPNDPSTTLNDVLLWDDDTLEHRHDYIQYLFPLPEPSGVNPDAPLITKEGQYNQPIVEHNQGEPSTNSNIVRDAFKADPGLRSRLQEALKRMKQFYYLENIPDSPTDSAGEHTDLRGTPYDPNSPFVRREDEARLLHSSLRGINKSFDKPIARSTIEFWDASMKWPLYRVPNIYKNETVEWLIDDDNTDDETMADESFEIDSDSS